MFGRILTISYSAILYKKKTKFTPKITLSGDWLKKAGFETGAKVKVEVLNNKLIITNNE
jgi:toxic protein SymE